MQSYRDAICILDASENQNQNQNSHEDPGFPYLVINAKFGQNATRE